MENWSHLADFISGMTHLGRLGNQIYHSDLYYAQIVNPGLRKRNQKTVTVWFDINLFYIRSDSDLTIGIRPQLYFQKSQGETHAHFVCHFRFKFKNLMKFKYKYSLWKLKKIHWACCIFYQSHVSCLSFLYDFFSVSTLNSRMCPGTSDLLV